jgi:hypothetical protein
MSESNIFKNAAPGHHQRKHHETAVPDVPSKDGNTRISEPTRENDEHNHRQKPNQEKERKPAMKTKLAQTLTGLAIAMAFFFSPLSSPKPFVNPSVQPASVTQPVFMAQPFVPRPFDTPQPDFVG